MRQRSILILLVTGLLVVGIMGCSLAQMVGRQSVDPTATFTKTPKPTFTATPEMLDTPTLLPTSTPLAIAPTNTPASSGSGEAGETSAPAEQPTNTPESKPQGIVNVESLNFRAGPGTNYAALGKVTRGDKLEVRMKTADNSWVRVCCYNDQEGWVASSYVDLSVPISEIQVDASVPPTPTPQPRPPTNTPPPVPPTNTPVPTPAYYYRAVNESCAPNAGITYIEGTVYEGTNRANGKIVRLSYAPDGPTVADYVTGTDAGKQGMYTHILEPFAPREGDWYLWVVDANGQRISTIGHIHTTASAEGAGACQQGVVDFAH